MQPRPSITKSSGETGGGAAGRRRLPLSCRASRFPFSPPPPCSPGHAKSNEARQLPARRGMEGATPPTGGAQSRAICATSFRSQLPGNSVLCLCSRPRGVSRRALCSRKKNPGLLSESRHSLSLARGPLVTVGAPSVAPSLTRLPGSARLEQVEDPAAASSLPRS